MPDIETVPEITTVNEPLLFATPSQGTDGGDRTSPSVQTLLGLFAGRRGASLIVRDNMRLYLEDWREAWGYSFPVVVIDTLWNLTFVVAALTTLFWFAREETNWRLRVWICGYATQCVVHVVLLVLEYKRRISTAVAEPNLISSSLSAEDDEDYIHPIRMLEKLNTAVSYMWMVVGLTWMSYSYAIYGTQRLLWLTLAFLATDMFFFSLRTLFYCFVSAACCFCLPCIIAFIFYAFPEVGASEADINRLPKYIFEVANDDVEQPDVGACRILPRQTNGPDFSTERVLLTEEADCCICLCHYEDGEQLHLLPCSHHFHSTCIVKWLKVKATCPVCKSLAV